MLSGTLDPRITPNTRFQADLLGQGDKGWIRYIGNGVSPKAPNAIYVGVEWDEENRGKHDGKVGSKRFFICPPGKGAFIHPSRVIPHQSLLQAVHERYEVPRNTEHFAVDRDQTRSHDQEVKKTEANDQRELNVELTMHGKTVSMPVTFAGEQKVLAQFQDLGSLSHITASGCGISSVLFENETMEELKSLFFSSSSLLLSDNLFYEWHDISTLLQTAPKLRQLDISGNNIIVSLPDTVAPTFESVSQYILDIFRVKSDSDESGLTQPRFLTEDLEVLLVNRVPSAWLVVYILATNGALPSLLELHVCQNNISALDTAVVFSRGSPISIDLPLLTSTVCGTHVSSEPSIFPKLRLLNLSHNHLSDWKKHILVPFGSLPNLRKLLLNYNLFTLDEHDGDVLELLQKLEQQPIPIQQQEQEQEQEQEAELEPFQNLIWLSITNNKIATWSSLSRLTPLRYLIELRIQNNPIVLTEPIETSDSSVMSDISDLAPKASSLSTLDYDKLVALNPVEARSYVISLLPQLRSLNLSTIRPRERTDAEKFYLDAVWKYFKKHHVELAVQDVMSFRNFQTGSNGAIEHGSPEELKLQVDAMFPPFHRLRLLHPSPIEKASTEPLSQLYNEFGGTKMGTKILKLNLIFPQFNTKESDNEAEVDDDTIPVPEGFETKMELGVRTISRGGSALSRGGRSMMRGLGRRFGVRSKVPTKIEDIQGRIFESLFLLPTTTIQELTRSVLRCLQRDGVNIPSFKLEYFEISSPEITPDNNSQAEKEEMDVSLKQHCMSYPFTKPPTSANFSRTVYPPGDVFLWSITLDDPLKTIDFYGVTTNGILFVHFM